MNKTIEKTFLKAFAFGGTVNKCIDVLKQKYDLGYKQHGKEEKQQPLSDKWEHFYKEVIPEQIKQETEAFDNSVIIYTESPLMEEIESNLLEYKTPIEKERYLLSLLASFKNFSDIYHPIAVIDKYKRDIEIYQKEIQNWNQCNEVTDCNGNNVDIKSQIDACKWYIEESKYQIERTYYVNKCFIEYTCQEPKEAGSPENCLSIFVGIASMFANRLDALLLQNNIDLMRLQQESGIYLKSHRIITDVDFYIGSMELAQKYIDELPKINTNNEETTGEPQQEHLGQSEALNLPIGLNTTRANIYFPKAIEAGIIAQTNTGYRKGDITQVQLAYFLELIFCRDNEGKDHGKDFPEKALNNIFGESRLGKARGQYMNNKEGKPKGYERIEKIFE